MLRVMAVILACIDGPPRGKRIEIKPGKPLPFKVRRHDQDAGQVVIELLAGQCVLTNRSQQQCLINGESRQRSVLKAGDRVQIGKNQFVVQIDDGDAGETQTLDPATREQLEMALAETRPPPEAEASAPAGVPSSALCSACDGRCGPGGWQGENQRICQRCWEKGVRPDHLPRPSVPSPPPEPLEAHAHPPEPRHAKRISASRLSAIEPEEKNGILQRFSSLLGHRSDKSRLDQLQQERERLLAEAGRLSLARRGCYGLSEETLAAMVAGDAITVDPHQVSRPSIDQWLSQRERMAVLDAEIAAVRRSLGLGPDPDAMLLPAPTLRPEDKERKDRAFATLDAVGTETLSEESPVDDGATTAPQPPATVKHNSGVRRGHHGHSRRRR